MKALVPSCDKDYFFSPSGGTLYGFNYKRNQLKKTTVDYPPYSAVAIISQKLIMLELYIQWDPLIT